MIDARQNHRDENVAAIDSQEFSLLVWHSRTCQVYVKQEKSAINGYAEHLSCTQKSRLKEVDLCITTGRALQPTISRYS